MPLLALAGVAAASGASRVFTYNRDAWMTDVQIKQNRRYQRQQVRLSQADMFREDIRDLVQASVTKQGNFVILSVLLLGMIAECYVEGPLPEGTAEFVIGAYLLCVSSAMVYMLLALLCAVWAQQLAAVCQKDLLTTLVRLPVEEFVAEIEAAMPHESVEAFEHQGLRTVLRVPGFSRCGSSSSDSEQEQGSADASIGFTSAGGGGGSMTQATHSELHLGVYQEREKDWNMLGTYALHFCVLGVSSLLEAYGYFAGAKYYKGDIWSPVVVQFTLVSLDAVLAYAYMRAPLHVALFHLSILASGPVAAVVTMRISDHWVDVLGVTACFACHFLWNCLGCWQVVALERAAGAAAAGDEKPPAKVQNPDKEQTAPMAPVMASRSAPLPDGESEPRRHRRRWDRGPAGKAGLAEAEIEKPQAPNASSVLLSERRRVVIMGSAVVLAAWLASLCWAIYSDAWGHVDNGVAHKPRELSEAAPGLATEVLAVAASAVAVARPGRLRAQGRRT